MLVRMYFFAEHFTNKGIGAKMCADFFLFLLRFQEQKWSTHQNPKNCVVLGDITDANFLF